MCMCAQRKRVRDRETERQRDRETERQRERAIVHADLRAHTVHRLSVCLSVSVSVEDIRLYLHVCVCVHTKNLCYTHKIWRGSG
jgi:hypothetical protein